MCLDVFYTNMCVSLSLYRSLSFSQPAPLHAYIHISQHLLNHRQLHSLCEFLIMHAFYIPLFNFLLRPTPGKFSFL